MACKAGFYGDKEPLLVGAAAKVAELPQLRDWLLDGQRDLEINDFCNPEVILGGEWAAQAEATRKALDGYTGRIGIHGPFIGLVIDSPDPEVTAVAQKRLIQGLEYGSLFGATHMVVHSPFHPFTDYSNPKVIERSVRQIHANLEPVVKKAEEVGNTLVIEGIMDYDSRGDIAIVKSFDSERVRLSIDTGHAQLQASRGGTFPREWINETGEYLQHVHIQDVDNIFDRHWAVGDGEINWYGVFGALAALDHQPRLIIETNPYDVMRSHAYLVERGLAR